MATSKLSGQKLLSGPIFQNGKKTCAVIDGNNFCIRSFYTQGSIQTPEAFITNSFKLITNLLTRYECDMILFAFDGGRKWRTELYASNPYWKSKKAPLGYKGGRSLHGSEDYATIKHYIEVFRKHVLNWVGIPNFTVPGVEADDVIFWITKNLHGVNKMIISADEDLAQCCKHPNTAWFTPIKNEFVTKHNFETLNGYGLENYLNLKAIIGDSSDNIEGIYGLSEKTLGKWEALSGEFPFKPFEWLEKYGTTEDKSRFLTPEMMQNFKISRQLMDSEAFAACWEGLDFDRFYNALFYVKDVEYKDVFKVIASTGVKAVAPTKIHGLVETLNKCSRTVKELRRTEWKS